MRAVINRFFLLLFPAILLIGVIWINVSAVTHYTKVKKLERNGIVTKTKLIEKEFNSHTKGPDTYYIIYSYSVINSNGKSKAFEVKKEVDESLYRLSNEGQEIEIRYQKDGIEVSEIIGNENYIKTIVICIIIDLLLIVSFFYFLKKNTRV